MGNGEGEMSVDATLHRVVAPVVLLSLLAGCLGTTSDSPRCAALREDGSWTLAMHADEHGYRVVGQAHFLGGDGRVEAVASTREGTGEPISVPIDDLRTTEDSVHLRFAPIGFRLSGRCISSGVIEGEFSVPQPPFDDVLGTWRMTRRSVPQADRP